MTYKTLNLSYTMERAIENRIDWEIDTGQYTPVRSQQVPRVTEYRLAESHFRKWLRNLDSVNCLAYLISATVMVGERRIYNYEVALMLDMPAAGVSVRIRLVERELFAQYQKMVGYPRREVFDQLVELVAEKLLNKAFENPNRRYII